VKSSLQKVYSRHNELTDCFDNHWRKPKGQSRMDNQETLVILDTQDTGRKQTKQKAKHRKLKR
jgi:hypothetical protein